MSAKTTKTRTTRVARSAVQFKEDTKKLKADIANLTTFASNIGRQGSVSVRMNDDDEEPVSFTAQDVKSFRSQINKKLMDMQAEYSIVFKGKKQKKEKKANQLPNLSKITDTYRDFWANADLGLVDPDPSKAESEDNPTVISMLPMLTDQGVTSSSLLQSAWATYIDVHKLKNKEAKKAKFIKADDHMVDSLGNALDWLEENTPLPEQKERYKKKKAAGKKAEEPEEFDRYAFKRFWLATIGSYYTVPRPCAEPSEVQVRIGNKKAMSEEEETELRDSDNRRSVQEEITLLKEVRNRWNKLLGNGKFATKNGKKANAEEEEEAQDSEEESEEESEKVEKDTQEEEEEEEEEEGDESSTEENN